MIFHCFIKHAQERKKDYKNFKNVLKKKEEEIVDTPESAITRAVFPQLFFS